MSARQDHLDRLDTAHAEFRQRIADLPPEAYEERWLGDWNLSQLLAHMAGWWREMAPAFARVAAGQRPTPEGVDYSDTDAWNREFAKHTLPAPNALADWDEAYADYRQAAEALGDGFYGEDPEKGRPRIGTRLLNASGTGHFEEHHHELESWLRSRRS